MSEGRTVSQPPYTPCPANKYGWHDLHGGCVVDEGMTHIALCRDCDQIIGPDGEPVK